VTTKLAAQKQAENLQALRSQMRNGGAQAFCVPRADEYLGEYIPEHNERLRWLTGFTGSAGMAVVLADRAAIFIDGRYTVQVRRQVDALALPVSAPHQRAAARLAGAEHSPRGSKSTRRSAHVHAELV
jgi:hypothetical protein